MKRSPLRRSTKPLKRTRLNPINKKKRKQLRDFSTEREIYKEEHRCPCGVMACDVHEIHGGSSRNQTYETREAWLAVCRECHRIIQYLPKIQQYGLKREQDREFFSCEKLNELAGWDRNAITEEEVCHAT